MSYTLKERSIRDHVRIFINADSNDADYISTLTSYSLSYLEDNEFLICIKAMRDLMNLKRSHDLEKCYSIWREIYEEDLANYLEYNLTEVLDIPRNDWDYQLCHTLCEFTVEVYKDGRLYDLVLNHMPDIPQEDN